MVSSFEFRNKVTKFVSERIKEATRVILSEGAKAIGTKIVRKTPVKTGLARGNMRLKIGTGFYGATPIARKDKSGRRAIADMIADAAKISAYGSFTVFNALPYIKRLEDGWSRQAPQGMFRLSYAEFKREMPKFARLVKNRLGSVTINV